MSRRHGPVKGIVVRAVVVPKGFEGCSRPWSGGLGSGGVAVRVEAVVNDQDNQARLLEDWAGKPHPANCASSPIDQRNCFVRRRSINPLETRASVESIDAGSGTTETLAPVHSGASTPVIGSSLCTMPSVFSV